MTVRSFSVLEKKWCRNHRYHFSLEAVSDLLPGPSRDWILDPGHSFAMLPEIPSMNWVLSDHQTMKLDMHRNTPSSKGSGIYRVLVWSLEAQDSGSWIAMPGCSWLTSSHYISSSLSTIIMASWRVPIIITEKDNIWVCFTKEPDIFLVPPFPQRDQPLEKYNNPIKTGFNWFQILHETWNHRRVRWRWNGSARRSRQYKPWPCGQ